MLGRRIKGNVSQNVPGRPAVYLRLSGNDVHPVLKVCKGIRWHKGIFRTVCPVVIHSALPRVRTAFLPDSLSRAGCPALAAPVAQMLCIFRCPFQYCIRENKTIPYKRAEVVVQQCAGKTPFSQPAPDCIVLLPSGTVYRFVLQTPIRLISLNFDYTQEHSRLTEVLPPVRAEAFVQGNVLEQVCFADAPALNAPIILPQMYELHPSLDRLLEERRKGLLYADALVSAILKETLLKILRFALVTSAGAYEKILCVIRYIEENYARPVTNDDLARLSGYHPYHINRLMNEYAGSSVHRYLLHYRLKKAQELLVNTTHSISEIAEECGFRTPYYFSNLFKENLGLSPLQYRKAQQNNI